jgi:4-hydroxyacetophenone monooxygenase
VELVTEPIDRIIPGGICTVDGREHELDVIVFATGFRANDFLWPMEVRGHNGASCETLWSKDGARAYLGVMLPGFPNFFMLYGPNMNTFGNGLGVIETQELATRFALSCIGELILSGSSTIEVEQAAYDRFNDALDGEEAKRVYSDRRTTSYYRNEHRRSACNCPFDIRVLWKWLRDPVSLREADASETVRPYIGGDLRLR